MTLFCLWDSRYRHSQCSGGHVTAASDGLERESPGSEAPQTHCAPSRDLRLNYVPSTRYNHIQYVQRGISLDTLLLTLDTMENCEHKGKACKKNRVGWSLIVKWFGKRTDMDWSIQMGRNYSLHRHPKVVNGTCSPFLPWTRYKVFVIVPCLYIFGEVLANWEWECVSPPQLCSEICHEELADLFHFHAMWFCLSRVLQSAILTEKIK